MKSRPLALGLLIVTLAAAGCISDDSGADEPPVKTGNDDWQAMNRTVDWGALETATIRPGASLGGYCTYNFLFSDARGEAYIGTAAHCTEDGERVTLGPGGPEIGTVVYDSDTAEDADASVDFSLIRLDPDQIENANPLMYGWDGPKGTIDADEASAGDQVAIYGYGILLGEDERTRPRFGVLMDEDGSTYRANLPAVNGDSGSPIIHVPTGKAFGIISHYGIAAVPPATDEGPIMGFIFSELENGGFDVTLATV